MIPKTESNVVPFEVYQTINADIISEVNPTKTNDANLQILAS